MNISDPIADMLTRVRNASRARHTEVVVPASRTNVSEEAESAEAASPGAMNAAQPATLPIDVASARARATRM